MKKLIIFDLDGTLLNTIEDITDAYNASLKDLNLPTIAVDEAKYVVGYGVKVNIDKCLKYLLKDDYNAKKDLYYASLIDKYMYYYSLFQRNKTRPYDGIIDCINSISSLGCKVVILSNKPDIDVQRIVPYYFSNAHFDKVYGVSDIVLPKPDPKGIISINKEFNNKIEDCIYVGDSEIDILTAKNANVKVIGCLWGFRKKEEISDADYLVNNPKEIVKIIKEM